MYVKFTAGSRLDTSDTLYKFSVLGAEGKGKVVPVHATKA